VARKPDLRLHRQPQRTGPTEAATTATPAADKSRANKRRGRNRELPKPRREEHQRVHHAGPPAQKQGFDPDSPFAALRSLKAALDKRTQE
jgi:hypothetical protein